MGKYFQRVADLDWWLQAGRVPIAEQTSGGPLSGNGPGPAGTELGRRL